MPLRAERLQRESLVAPVEKESTQVIYLNARRSDYALPKYRSAPRKSAPEYLLAPSNRDPSPRYGKGTDSSATDPLNTSVLYNVYSIIAELEKRRATLFAQARAAEARAREAEEKFEQFKSRLKQETNRRLGAEQRLRNFEEDRPRQPQAAEIERMKTTEAALAHTEAEVRLKHAERRIEEAEKDVTTLTFALTKAYQKKAEAEAAVRVAEEKANKIEALVLGAEPGDHEVVERNLVFGLLVFANTRAEDERNARRNTKDASTELTMWREGGYTSSNLLKSVNATKQKGVKRKFIIYGSAIMLLVGVCCWLIATLS